LSGVLLKKGIGFSIKRGLILKICKFDKLFKTW